MRALVLLLVPALFIIIFLFIFVFFFIVNFAHTTAVGAD